jgi:carbon-monoxide dehydrogenase small subunit
MEAKTIILNVNKQSYEISINPKLLLVEALRDVIGLTGTKRGCETVSCGACTVHIDGMAVRSCAVLAMQAIGHEITTVEGLETNGKLAPIQEGFLDEGAFQCGFCTPGMLMATSGLLNDKPNPTEWQVRQSIEGNICRCTGYNSIVRAVLRTAAGIPAGPNPADQHAHH